MLLRFAFVSVGMALAAGQALAEDPLAISGFLTTGTAVSDTSQPYQGVERRPNLSKYTKLGINLTKRVADDWRVAVQFVSRDQLMRSDWAFIAYRASPWFEARFGKVKFPVWAISDHIDVGNTYVWTTPPEEVYSINPLTSVNGASFNFGFNFGNAEWVTEIVLGGVDDELVDTKVKANDVYSITTSIGLDPLRFRLAYNRADVSFVAPYIALDNLQTKFLAFGAFGEWKNFVYSAESVSLDTKVEGNEVDSAEREAAAAAGKAAQTGSASDLEAAELAGARYYALTHGLLEARAWYSMVGYRLGSFLPHTTHARVRVPHDSLFFGSQDSYRLGLKYDVSPTTDVKVEAIRVVPLNETHGLFAAESVPKGGKWKPANIYALTFDQVF